MASQLSRYVSGLYLIACLLGLVPQALASGISGVVQESTCETIFRRGVEGFVGRDYRRARPDLEHAFANDPACALPQIGLAGDWLGRLWLVENDTVRALDVWERTLAALREDTWERGGDQLVGQYLEALLRSGRAAEPRTSVAFDLVMRPTAGGAMVGEPYWRALAQIASVVPDSVRREAFVGGDWSRGVAPGGGRRLAEWWVSEDPYPATEPNERVVEHLGRVTTALRSYPEPSAPKGYDDRGDLLVRFGPPTTAKTLTYNDPRFVFALAELPTGVSRHSFPDNEIWTYDRLGEAMTYILVESGGPYRVGQTVDLLPNQLRNVVASSPRTDARRTVALTAMRYIYEQLATTALEYGDAWAEVDAILTGTASPVRNPGSDALTIQRALMVRETERERVRDDQEPSSHSTVYDAVPHVPVAVDVARFLESDGTTRLDLWWQVRPIEDEDRLERGGAVATSVVRDPWSLDRTTETVVLQTLSQRQASGREPAATAEATFDCGRQPCAPALQFDLYGAAAAGRRLGPRLRSSVWRSPTHVPLRTDGLEMSDLKPIAAISEEPLAAPAIAPGLQLAIYFEGYGFITDPGEARVTIEYEIVRRQRGSLLRRTVETPRAGELRLVKKGSTTEQHLLISTVDWQGADEVDVTVRLRDERAGTEVERTRTFYVATDRDGA